MGRWSTEERNLNEAIIRELYEAKPEITYTEIEDRTGIPRQTVRQVFKRLGFEQSSKRNARGPRFKLSKEREVHLTTLQKRC